MILSADQIHCHAAARIELRRIRFAVRIDGYQHSLACRPALKDALFVGQHNGTEIAVIERL